MMLYSIRLPERIILLHKILPFNFPEPIISNTVLWYYNLYQYVHFAHKSGGALFKAFSIGKVSSTIPKPGVAYVLVIVCHQAWQHATLPSEER